MALTHWFVVATMVTGLVSAEPIPLEYLRCFPEDQCQKYYTVDYNTQYSSYPEPDDFPETRVLNISNFNGSIETILPQFSYPFYGFGMLGFHATQFGYLSTTETFYSGAHNTELISPLQGLHVTSHDNESTVSVYDSGSSVYVWWKDTYMLHPVDQGWYGPFSFQAQIYETGEIRFLYKEIAIDLTLPSNNLTFVSGLANGYYVQEGQTRQVLGYHYTLIRMPYIAPGVEITFTPVPNTCQDHLPGDDCQTHANDGFCETSEVFMQRYCCLACEALIVTSVSTTTQTPPPIARRTRANFDFGLDATFNAVDLGIYTPYPVDVADDDTDEKVTTEIMNDGPQLNTADFANIEVHTGSTAGLDESDIQSQSSAADVSAKYDVTLLLLLLSATIIMTLTTDVIQRC